MTGLCIRGTPTKNINIAFTFYITLALALTLATQPERVATFLSAGFISYHMK
jgi:hypothetical protein